MIIDKKTILKIICFFITVYLFNVMGYIIKYFSIEKEQNYFLNAFSPIIQFNSIQNGEVFSTILGILFFTLFKKMFQTKLNYWAGSNSNV